LRVNVRSSRREMLGRESGTHPFPTLCPEASNRCKEQRPESRERLRGRGIREREQDSLQDSIHPLSLAGGTRLTENVLQSYRSACGPAPRVACARSGLRRMQGNLQANEKVGQKRLQRGDDLDGSGASASRKQRKMVASSSEGIMNWRHIYGCTTWSKAFKTNSELTTHLRVHSGDKPCSCDACGKAFATSSALTTHLRVHSDDKPGPARRQTRL
jgi:uncharacterized Zn-finger protein